MDTDDCNGAFISIILIGLLISPIILVGALFVTAQDCSENISDMNIAITDEGVRIETHEDIFGEYTEKKYYTVYNVTFVSHDACNVEVWDNEVCILREKVSEGTHEYTYTYESKNPVKEHVYRYKVKAVVIE